jgi:transcriptional regulator with XRE-family HTH domain
MAEWEVLVAEEFELEFHALHTGVQDEILALSLLLRKLGPQLGRPRVDTLKNSRHANMKELRFSVQGAVWRVAFAFDPKRRAVLLLAGDKSGGSERRFYRELIRKADDRFDAHFNDWDAKGSKQMAKNVREIIKALPVSRRKKIAARARELMAEEMTLQELRLARKLTQERLAKSLGIKQKQISAIERRTDMHISTLRRALKAMGGSLELVVEFRDRKPVTLKGIASAEPDSTRRLARNRRGVGRVRLHRSA